MSSDDGPPRVFVSYAHDNAEHIAQVLRFCRLLRGNGIDAWLDRYDSNERRDWYAWYLNQVTGADYVLIVASPGYHAAGDGNGPATSRRGVQTEAAHLRDLLHADRPTWIRRLLPVVLPGRSVHEIPCSCSPPAPTTTSSPNSPQQASRDCCGPSPDSPSTRRLTSDPYPCCPRRSYPTMPRRPQRRPRSETSQ
jgi:TIR domain